jgi:hypothetical protein
MKSQALSYPGDVSVAPTSSRDHAAPRLLNRAFLISRVRRHPMPFKHTVQLSGAYSHADCALVNLESSSSGPAGSIRPPEEAAAPGTAASIPPHAPQEGAVNGLCRRSSVSSVRLRAHRQPSRRLGNGDGGGTPLARKCLIVDSAT